ncbi:ATP-binding protein [uncultured Rhodoferax sp.]|uniref:sensor histidine kinase n=1 Tax=uncultured Rhodoferax sp. TaxID=223188 RepID=UPI0025DE9A0C|nr:ATP-binding protein [uncultured Rhodoferax sp.]
MLQTSGGTFSKFPPAGVAGLSDWKTVSLPHVLPRDLVATVDDEIVTTWYRIAVPDNLPAMEPGELRLYLPRWQTIGQIGVYVDGQLVQRSGGSPIWNGFNHPLWVVLNATSESAAPRNVVLRVDHYRSAGVAISSVWLGDEEGLGRWRGWREWLQADVPYIFSTSFLFIGFFAAAVWAMRREALYGLFFISATLYFLRTLHFHVGLEPLPISDDWFGWLTILSLNWLLVSGYAFGFRLHKQRYRRSEIFVVIVLLLATIATLPPLAATPQLARWAPAVYLVSISGVILLTFLGLWAAWRSDSGLAKLLSAWNALNIPAGIHDWMLQNYKLDIEGVYLLPYHGIVIFSIFIYIVYQRYTAALAEAELMNATLEEKLKAREHELMQQNQRLREIENEQLLSLERQRIMQDMHDGVGSSLMVALKVIEEGKSDDLAEILRACIDDLKLAVDSLEPVQADLLLLLATLRFRLGPRLEQAGLTLKWNVDDVPRLEWLEPQSALHIMRIVQEVLSNAIKHSQADFLVFSTHVKQDRVVLGIQDNGIGFATETNQSPGRGLTNVRRRAQAIGANVIWQSNAEGTVFELWLPINAAEPAPV